MIRRRRVARIAARLVGLVTLVTLVLAGSFGPGGSVTAAAPPFGMWVDLGDHCITGAGPAGTRLRFELRTRSGVLRGRGAARVGSDGRYHACILGGSSTIDATNVLIGRLGDARRRLAIPALAPHVDRATGVVQGRARPGELVDIAKIVDRVFRGVQSTIADADGHYRLDLGSRLEAATELIATVHRGRDRVSGIGRAIRVDLRAGSAMVSGIAGSPDGVRLVLRASDGSWRARADQQIIDSPPSGEFGTFFADRQGRPVIPVAGDRVVWKRAGVDLVVPRAGVRARAGDVQVRGWCAPERGFLLEVSGRRDDRWYSREIRGKADARGRFTVTAASPLQVGDDLRLTCALRGGDRIMTSGSPSA